MITKNSRRTFLKTGGAVAGSALAALSRISRSSAAPASKSQKFLVGYAPATDGTLDDYWMRMEALSKIGLRHVEVDNTFIKIAENYGGRPTEFRDRMAKLNLRLVGVNQSYRFGDASKTAEIREMNTLVGKFLKDVGAIYLGWEGPLSSGTGDQQIVREGEMRQIARLANEEGKRIREDYGIKLTYHTHSTLGFRRLMDLTRPEYLSLNPDLGWLLARGGGDAMEICRAYRSRIQTLHFKDFDPDREYTDRGKPGKGGMVVPGNGKVNFPAVVEFLKETDFEGCVLGEHIGLGNYDFVRSPREVEVYPRYKAYFTETLGLKL